MSTPSNRRPRGPLNIRCWYARRRFGPCKRPIPICDSSLINCMTNSLRMMPATVSFAMTSSNWSAQAGPRLCLRSAMSIWTALRLATGGYVGEGFDDARLDTLFLTLPVSWRGTIAQYAGRLHRLNDRKREVRIYDYADLDVPMLARMFDRRCRGYQAIGYRIVVPASAVPGWPAEVPLPSDPEGKRDYAASVKRLIRDGVDAPLGNLFVTVAKAPAPG